MAAQYGKTSLGPRVRTFVHDQGLQSRTRDPNSSNANLDHSCGTTEDPSSRAFDLWDDMTVPDHLQDTNDPREMGGPQPPVAPANTAVRWEPTYFCSRGRHRGVGTRDGPMMTSGRCRSRKMCLAVPWQIAQGLSNHELCRSWQPQTCFEEPPALPRCGQGLPRATFFPNRHG